MTDRKSPLEMDGARFRELGYRAVDRVAELLDSIRSRPVNRDITPTEVRALLPSELPDEGRDAAELIDDTARLLFDHSLFNGHPKFLGYITSSAAPIGMLADLLAASVNANLGGWQLSPVASEIEGQTVRWIGELMGYPTSGGSARHRETTDDLRLGRDPHLASEGRGHLRAGDRQRSLDRR